MIARWQDIHQMLGAMDMFRSRMNSVFSEFDRTYKADQGWIPAETAPRTNLNDTGDNLVMIAEVPGVNREDLQVKIQGNYLQISGVRSLGVPEGYKVHRTERGATTFSRSFTLPYEVNADKVDATLRDGLLTLTMPKSEAAKPRQISIQ